MRGLVATIRRRFRRRASVVIVPLLVAAAPVAGAEDGGADPTVHDLFKLDHLETYMEFEAEYRHARVDTHARQGLSRRSKQINRQRRFEERIGLSLSGSIIDPEVMTFGGDFSFALTQSRFDEGGDAPHRTDRDNGHLLTFDLRADFFPGKKLSGSVFGLRRDDRIDRRFQPSLRERRTSFGTTWDWADDTLPMHLSYRYEDTDRTNNANRADDEHLTESVLDYGLDWIIDAHHRITFSYQHAETSQDFQGAARNFKTTRDLFLLDQELEFGGEKEHRFTTNVRWQEESGDFARDLFEIGPQLTLKHTDNLETSYKYQYNRERYEGIDVQTHRVDFQLIHQVYTNLTTTVDVFGLYESTDEDIETTQYGASVDWQYNRGNRWGRLYVNLALAYDTEEIDGDNGNRIVLDEAHTFRDPVVVTLRNRNAIARSIIVTDTTNRRLFRRGVDYLVIEFSNVVQITRVRTGAIADGDTVLVDYLVRTPSRGQLDTVRVDFSIEQRFDNGLTPYYRLAYRNQEDDPTIGFASRADRTDHHRLGVRYEADRYALGFELEIFDDTIEPYDAFHVDGLLHVLREPDHTIDASARVLRMFFEGGVDDRNVTLIDVTLDHRWRLSESLSTLERVAYRHENDSVGGTTQGWDVSAGLEYVRGDLSAELTFEYDRLDLPGSEEDDYGVYLRVRRDLGDLLTRR